jgi:hypothetical protein
MRPLCFTTEGEDSRTLQHVASHSQQYYSPQDCSPQYNILDYLFLGNPHDLSPLPAEIITNILNTQKHLGAAEDRNIRMAYTLRTFLNYVTNAY